MIDNLQSLIALRINICTRDVFKNNFLENKHKVFLSFSRIHLLMKAL